jgi:hypothetical protein
MVVEQWVEQRAQGRACVGSRWENQAKEEPRLIPNDVVLLNIRGIQEQIRGNLLARPPRGSELGLDSLLLDPNLILDS